MNFDYTKNDVIESLVASGVTSGDKVLCYTSLGLLGMPENVGNAEELNKLFFDCLCEVVGEKGTVFVPTYTYSLCKGEIFDSRETPSAIGPFTEYFRRQKGVVRSFDPILSTCGLGKDADLLRNEINNTCYGKGSFFEKLTEADGKICCIGLHLHWATYRHYIEEIAQIPFRYRKWFYGKVRESGVVSDSRWKYSVRLWVDNADPDGKKLGDMVVGEGLAKQVELGRNYITTVSCQDYFNFSRKCFIEDPWISARGPAGDPVFLEEQRTGVKKYHFNFNENSDSEEILNQLVQVPRNIVSDGVEACLEAIGRVTPLEISSYITGYEGVDFLVPEKWSCSKAAIMNLNGEIVLSMSDDSLQVAGYSSSFSGVVTKVDLLEHYVAGNLNSGEGVLDRYYNKHWGWACNSFNNIDNLLIESEYQVDISTSVALGELKVAQAFFAGESKNEILVGINICGLGKDAVTCRFAEYFELFCRLAKASSREHSWRFLFIPDNIGLAAWYSDHKGILENIVGFFADISLEFPAVFDNYLDGKKFLSEKDILSMVENLTL